MSEGEEQVRERLLVRLRKHFAVRRSPRATMSAILIATGFAGFVASIVMLKCGLGHMGLRYPLAVLFAWGIFLALVRAWAARESGHFRVEEHLGEDALTENAPPQTRRVQMQGKGRRRKSDGGWDWLDWLDFSDVFDGDGEGGCLLGIAAIVIAAIFLGALMAVAGLIGGAEAVFAELFLDAVLLSALAKRLSRLKPRWWVAGVLRQTMWPVLFTAVSLMVAGFLLRGIVPDAKSVGGVWRHYHPAPTPQLERE